MELDEQLINSRMHFRYILLGAALFKAWENWGYLDASYFCFISLSSIGFGDLVPGAAVRNPIFFATHCVCVLIHSNSLKNTFRTIKTFITRAAAVGGGGSDNKLFIFMV
jgi:hypothetical protein